MPGARAAKIAEKMQKAHSASFKPDGGWKQRTLSGEVLESIQGTCPPELQEQAVEIRKFAAEERAELFVCMCYPARGSSEVTVLGKLPGKLLQLVAEKAGNAVEKQEQKKNAYFEAWAVLSILAQDEWFQRTQRPCFPSHSLPQVSGFNLSMLELMYRQNRKGTQISVEEIRKNFLLVLECAIRYFDYIGAITLIHPVSVTLSKLTQNWFHPDEVTFYATVHILGTAVQIEKLEQKLYHRIETEAQAEHKYITGNPQYLQPIVNSVLMQRLVAETEMVHMQPSQTENIIVPWPEGLGVKLMKKDLACIQPVNASFS